MRNREPRYVLTTDDLAAYGDSRAVHWLTTHDATGRTFDLLLLWDLTRSQRPVELVQ